MCGIWGFNCRESGKVNFDHVENMIRRADERGGHSYGVYGITANGKHVSFKSEGRANPVLILEIIKNCVVAIGHSRLASSASIDLFNSQPVVTKDVILVHNGNIDNHESILNEYNYSPVTNLDSEAIVPMLKAGKIDIYGTFLALKLTEYDHEFIYYSGGLPLHYMSERVKPDQTNHYYCSKEWGQKS